MSNSTTIDIRPMRVPVATGAGRQRSALARRLARATALAAAGIAILTIPMALRLGLFALGHPHMRFVGEMMRAFR